MEKHGKNTPETYRRNNNRIPIDGIWASPGVSIENGGYFIMTFFSLTQIIACSG
jgi:hypothetical protein